MKETAHADISADPGRPAFVVKRTSLVYAAFCLIIPFCSYAIHIDLPVPPTLVLFVIGTLLLFCVSGTMSSWPVVLLPLICIFYFAFTQPFTDSPAPRYIGVLSAIAYFVVTVLFGGHLSTEQRRRQENLFFLLSNILLVAECFWRVTHPDLTYQEFEGIDSRWIYQYKMTGFMYKDSNVVGFHIMIVLFFLLYQEKELGIRRPISRWILLALLVLSFSRAAWTGAAVGWIYVQYLQNKKLDFYLFYFMIFLVLLTIVYFLFLKEKFESDLSYQSKLEILQYAKEYLSSVELRDLFLGVGFSKSDQALHGVYAHSFFLVILIESGLIGLFLVVALFVHFIRITRRKALILLIPFVLSTLSNTVLFIPYFYVFVALMYFDRKDSMAGKSPLPYAR